MSRSSSDTRYAPRRASARTRIARFALALVVTFACAVWVRPVSAADAEEPARPVSAAHASNPARLVRAFVDALAPGMADAADTTSTDSARAPRGTVRIRIDEHGVSVHGDVDLDGDDVGDIRLNLGDGGYREKGRDIVRFGEGVTVESDEIVRGDLVVVGADARVEGHVTGNVAVIGGRLSVGPDAEIRGDAIVVGGGIDEAPGALIRGERVVVGNFRVGGAEIARSGLRRLVTPLTLAGKLMVALVAVLFLGPRLRRAGSYLTGPGEVARAGGVGAFALVVACIITPIAMILLAITLIGIPLAFLLMLAVAIVFLIGWTVSALALGDAVLSRGGASPGAFAAVLVGIALLSLPRALAWLAGLAGAPLAPAMLDGAAVVVSLVAYLVGLGALVSSRFGSRDRAPRVPAATVVSPQPE